MRGPIKASSALTSALAGEELQPVAIAHIDVAVFSSNRTAKIVTVALNQHLVVRRRDPPGTRQSSRWTRFTRVREDLVAGVCGETAPLGLGTICWWSATPRDWSRPTAL